MFFIALDNKSTGMGCIFKVQESSGLKEQVASFLAGTKEGDQIVLLSDQGDLMFQVISKNTPEAWSGLIKETKIQDTSSEDGSIGYSVFITLDNQLMLILFLDNIPDWIHRPSQKIQISGAKMKTDKSLAICQLFDTEEFKFIESFILPLNYIRILSHL